MPLDFCPTPVGVPSGILIPQNLNSTSGDFDQWAVFSQVSYDLTDALEITAALRYDRDDREQTDVLTGRTDEATFDDVQPKLSLAWKITPSAMLYATYAEGYKSGTFNPLPPPGATFPLVVEQEGTESFEVGAKTTWFDQRLVANLSAYLTNYDKPQIFRFDVTTGGQVAINAKEAEIKGVELELATRVTSGLDLTFAYGYTDAKFTDFNGTGLFDDNRLPNTPRYTLQAGARYERPVTATASLVARVDYLKTGSTYFGEDNLMYQPDYQTVDVRLGLQRSKWKVALWVATFSTSPMRSPASRAPSRR